MKFMSLTFVGIALLVFLTYASLGGWILPFGILPLALLRLFAISSFPISLITLIYSQSQRRAFAAGWAICLGVALTLIITGVPIIGQYLRYSPDPYFATAIDVAFSIALAYLGGIFARTLQRNSMENLAPVADL